MTPAGGRIAQRKPNHHAWTRALLHALPVSAVVLALMAYWYGAANRAIVFLYDHDMGPRYPDTGPFSDVTRSRYWMSGLVAAGAVLVLYTLAAFCLGRLRRGYRPPPWSRVWMCCALVLVPGIPAITMTLKAPVLPLADALLVTAYTLVGLVFALVPAATAATAPGQFLWLAIEGGGAAAVAVSVSLLDRAVELQARGIVYGLVITAVGMAVGLGVLAMVAYVRRRANQTPPSLASVLAGGVCLLYLLLPLAHYLFFSDSWLYITDRDNFFPRQWPYLVAGWSAAAALVWLFHRTTGRAEIK